MLQATTIRQKNNKKYEDGPLVNGPFVTESQQDKIWFWAMANAERYYMKLIENGWVPQEARSILPNSLKTEIVITANFREWRLILKQRTSKAAHPQMRELMVPLLEKLSDNIPVIFDDIIQ